MLNELPFEKWVKTKDYPILNSPESIKKRRQVMDEWFENVHARTIDSPLPVLSKKDFVRRYARGEFGNCSPTWDDYLSWSINNLGINKLTKFHIRNRIAGGQTWYDVRKFEMADKWEEACRAVDPENLYISAMCPTEKTVLQGEVMQGVNGLYLYYSQVRKPMRDALKEEAHEATGVCAKLLLEKFMDWNSLDWLNGLLDRYPDHVVEFTTLSVKWGTVPGYNTLFWEVRKY